MEANNYYSIIFGQTNNNADSTLIIKMNKIQIMRLKLSGNYMIKRHSSFSDAENYTNKFKLKIPTHFITQKFLK